MKRTFLLNYSSAILYLQRKPYKGLTNDISFNEYSYNNNTVYDISTIETMSTGDAMEIVQATWTPQKIFNYTEFYLQSVFKDKTLILGVKEGCKFLTK